MLVPEAEPDAAGRTIVLPIVRIRTQSKSPGHPIFFLGGGPGQSNIGFRPPPELLLRHDFVMVGYRGVDGSIVLDCPEVSRALRGTGRDLLAEQSLDRVGDAFASCAARLSATGIDLSRYTMLDVVRDMESARSALGYQRVNLLSASYGTRVAQIYALQHPTRLHRSVMVAANPPGRFVWEPAMADRQLAQYAQLCASDPYCASRTQDLSESIRSVAAAMPRRWLFLPIDPGKVRVTSFALLFNRDTVALVLDAFLAAEQGDPSGLALLSLAYDFVLPRMFVWGDMAAKAVSADFDPGRDYLVEMDPPESTLGAPLSKLLWSTSTRWPTTPLGEQYRQARSSDVETLVISGNLDFSTPAEYATEQLLPTLSRGRQLVLTDLGHVPDLLGRQRPATRQLLSTFYASGLVDDSGIVHIPMDFRVRIGLPTIARMGLAAISLLVVVMIGLGWWLARRIFRRRSART
jgi:pimeloyl-ACP methyl ester carboxylesterase